MKCPKCHSENPDDTLFCSKCGTQLPKPEDVFVSTTKTFQTSLKELTIGSTFAGRYQVIEELGKGGMGRVYKVLDKEIKEKVALKLLNPEIAADEKTIERFRNELKFARKISHRNVCRMFDLSREGGTYFITMEYVSGEDLKSSIRRVGPLSAGKAVFIARQVCEGLAEAHRLGVVHRDLKPQNIMIDREGNARIMDFGIARSVKAKGITDAGVMIGTPEYMSVEQVEGKKVDQRSDIYSFGVILYEMVTGRLPFEGDTPLSIAVKHKSEAAPDPRKINAQIPENLSRVILQCMEKDKENRYESADQLLTELTNIEKGIPTTERVLPKTKPSTSKEITVSFSLKKLLIPALAVIAVTIIAIILLPQFYRKEKVSLPAGKPSLAIMYFENNTGDENLDHWRKALSDLLITDLAQSKYITVLSGDRLFNILSQLDQLEVKSYSSDILKQVAARGGTGYILVGKYAKAGENFRIDVMLEDAGTGQLLGSERVEGVGEGSIFSMVDELTGRIKTNFRLSTNQIAGDIDRAVDEITTKSPEAYKYYSEARKYHDQRDYRKSIELMQKAVDIDPDFAMAYRSLAVSYGNLGYSSEHDKYARKAFELSDRVSDRERYLIQGEFYSQSEETYDKAIEAYLKLLQLYPDDATANNNLGVKYYEMEEWDKARERLEVCIRNKDVGTHAYSNLAYVFAAQGRYDKAREILEYYLNNISDNVSFRASVGYYYLFRGEFDRAITEVDKALSIDPYLFGTQARRGDIYYYIGDLSGAETQYRKLLELEEPMAHAFGREGLASLYLLQGRFGKSKDQLKQGVDLAEKLGEKSLESQFRLGLAYGYRGSRNPQKALEECSNAWNGYVEAHDLAGQRLALYVKGCVYLEMNEPGKAQKIADELKELIDKGMNRKIIRLHHHLTGMIELERGNLPEAIENFEMALSLLPFQTSVASEHALFMEPLALAYYKAGDLKKAQEEYEKITSLTTGRLHYGDIYARSFYMLGKICQEGGSEAKAIEHFSRFLELWKDADPGIPEVEDAKERLKKLRVQS